MPGPAYIIPINIEDTSLPLADVATEFEELVPGVTMYESWLNQLSDPDLTTLEALGYKGFFYFMTVADIWSYLDNLWVPTRNETDSLISLVTPGTNSLSVGGTPTFDASTNRGWIADSTSDFLNTGFNPSTDATQYTLNDALIALGTASKDAGAASSNGVSACGNTNTALSPGGGSSDFTACRINNTNGTGSAQLNVTTPLGLSIGFRTSSTNVQVYKHFRTSVSFNLATNGITSSDLWILQFNNDNSFNNEYHNLFAVGKSMPEAKRKIFEMSYNWLMKCLEVPGF